ncbi:hypothetical protein GPECTOR_11g205 [Gonium pectorale]|uniref:CASTOR/POLLUX/SYM8 ion channel conserved domain-containing protein n=1 Tax=Gonium pectorale TaxID=33097 RepID=A0A150GPM8_GONPE|nr:hypothetical protein GPECTOR_11g205 [Gonium pectorale]|eukprot:KXZ51761.1 hypothetical protein GPECTOR_11g205 [Gonium pectorale]
MHHGLYIISEALTLPSWGKLLLVVAIAAPVLVVSAFVLCALGKEGEPRGEEEQEEPGQVESRKAPLGRFRDALLRCYCILNNVPGTDIVSEPDRMAFFVLNAMYIVGLFTFAVVIGVLSDDIQTSVAEARLGNSPVPERGHTVILGHNRQLVEVVRQVATVRADRGSAVFPAPLVVLAPLERAKLEQQLKDELGAAAAAAVVTRQGSPLQLLDLQRVAAGRAQTVIVLAPDEEGGPAGGETGAGGHSLSAEAQQAVTLAALEHLRSSLVSAASGRGAAALGDQTVVVQHDSALDLIRAAAGERRPAAERRRELVSVSSLNSLARTQAQCATQPGLSAVLSSLLQQRAGSPEFYISELPHELRNRSYGEVRGLFRRAVLCGLYDADAAVKAAALTSEEERMEAEANRALILNPSDDTVVESRHSLVLLADTVNDLQHEPGVPAAVGSGAGARRSAAGGAAQELPPPAPPSPLPPPAAVAAGSGGLAGAAAQQPVAGGVAIIESSAAGATGLRVVVLSFDGRMPEELLGALAKYCPPQSEAVVVAVEGSEAATDGGADPEVLRDGLRIRVLVADPRERKALAEAGVEGADSVVLAGSGPASRGPPTTNADAQALATQLQLHALMAACASSEAAAGAIAAGADTTAAASATQSGPAAAAAAATGSLPQSRRAPLNLVCAVKDKRVREVMAGLEALQTGGGGGRWERRSVVVDALNADEMLAGILTQVAAEPRLAGLFHQLSSVEGVEIYMRSPAALGLPYNEPLAWKEVQDAGRQAGTTVIGLLREADAGAGAGGSSAASPLGRLQLGLPVAPGGGSGKRGAEPELILRPGDKLVVLAEEDLKERQIVM